MGPLPIYIEEVPEYEARGDIMFVRWRKVEIALPISICEKAIAGCNRELDRWHESHGHLLRFPAGGH